MVSDLPSPSRRAVIAGSGGLLGTALGGQTFFSDGTAKKETFDAPWPMARHDQAGTSFAEGTTVPSNGVEVTWEFAVGDHGGFLAPTPIVAGGLVYVAADGLVAVDATDGSERFQFPNSPRTPPAVATATAYQTPTVAMTGNPTVGLHGFGGPAVIGRRPFTKRWTTAQKERRDLFGFGGGNQTPPVAVDGTILSYGAGALSAIDASKGALRWQADDARGRPVVHDETVYAYGLGSIYAFDLATGERRSVAEFDTGIRSLTATPDRLLVGTYESLIGLSYDGSMEWEYSPSGQASREEIHPAFANGVTYASFSTEDGDRLVALNASDGSVSWTAPVSVEQGGESGTLAVSENSVCFSTPDQSVVVLDRADGSVRWRFDIDTEYPLSSVTLSADRLYVVGNETLYALGAT